MSGKAKIELSCRRCPATVVCDVTDAPSDPADPVCDNCIGERLVAGDLERIEGHYS